MDILVYADWVGLGGPLLMGSLSVNRTKGCSVFAFAYAQSWLDGALTHALDPNLQLYSGAQYLPDNRPNFGLFLDSSPDRWGSSTNYFPAHLHTFQHSTIRGIAADRNPERIFQHRHRGGIQYFDPRIFKSAQD